MNIKSKLSSILRLLVVLPLLLASCTMPVSSSASVVNNGLIAWLDQPLASATIPLAPFTLKAHAQNSAGGVNAIEFRVNGVTLTSVPTDSSKPIVYAEFAWNPSTAGEYEIRAVATHGGERGESESAHMCVSTDVKEISLGMIEGQCGKEGGQPAANPPAESAAPSALNLNYKFVASPDPIYYGACTNEPRTIDFEAYLFDASTGKEVDPALVSSVNVHYTIHNSAGASGEFLLSLAMAGIGFYKNPVDINDKALSALGSGDGTIDYWIEVLDSTGASMQSPTSSTMNLINCKGAAPITPTNTTIPLPKPPTDTPVPPKPADTTPPAVNTISASAYDVYYQTGCGANTLTVQAYVTDDSGVGSVTLILNYVGKSLGANIPMTPIGGNMYQATYDVGGQAYSVLSGANGQISIIVQAQDTLGNTSSGDGGVVNVSFCPG